MSDFVIRKKSKREAEIKTVSIVKPTKKEVTIIVKIVLFLAALIGLIFLSVSNENLMLNEILVVSGILGMVFFLHLLSNQ